MAPMGGSTNSPLGGQFPVQSVLLLREFRKNTAGSCFSDVNQLKLLSGPILQGGQDVQTTSDMCNLKRSQLQRKNLTAIGSGWQTIRDLQFRFSLLRFPKKRSFECEASAEKIAEKNRGEEPGGQHTVW